MAAAQMAGRLLEGYALTMNEIEVCEQRCVQLEVRIGGLRRRPVDCCVTAVARFCGCKVWFSRDEAGMSYALLRLRGRHVLGQIGSASKPHKSGLACLMPERDRQSGYLRVPIEELRQSLAAAGIEMARRAGPVFYRRRRCRRAVRRIRGKRLGSHETGVQRCP